MMIKQMRMGLIALAGVVLWSFTPGVVHAATPHTFNCNDCHRIPSTANPRAMGNVCVNCHIKSGAPVNPVDRFDVGTASDTLGHNGQAGTDSGGETSHNWGGVSASQLEAGSSTPPTSYYYSKYKVSTNRVTCTICHDPHGQAGPNHLVRIDTAGDLICQQCHGSWFILNDSNDANPVNDTNAMLTHPVVTDYATFAATKPNDYNAAPSNSSNGGTGEIRLVNGGVSCTTCHAPHYADSSSSTTDGTASYNSGNILTFAKGDGNILRADGPERTGVTRNGATGTAQLRSNLCQSCHKIELHGQGLSGDHRIGCLDCHGGHAYNGGTPNAYILNKMTPDAVPTRPNRVNGISVQVTFFINNYPNGGSTRTKWADENVPGTGGFCEKCHGDCNSPAMVLAAGAHGVGDTNECSTCHKHNDPANNYSFNRDASAATCGQCHGYPPYKNVPGDRLLVPANDGGYGENRSADPNTPYDYVTSTNYEKDETKTGHKVHAGRDIPDSSDVPPGPGPLDSDPDDWYFVGNSGIDNCKVCHGVDTSTTAGGHRDWNSTTRADSFRDVPFDGIAKTGGMVPVYQLNSPWTCSQVYCHTNGAPYIGASRPTRTYTGVNVTPPWVGTGVDYAAGGYGSIYNQADRCALCHGNDTTTMSGKSNSAAHQAHLGGATTLNMVKVFDCKVCHVNTAGSKTALKVGAMDGRNGVGKHVNGTIEVDFETGATPDTLPEAMTGSTYTAGTGVCSTYCHNSTGGGSAMTADWDVTTDMQCDSCHGGLLTDTSANGGYGPVTTGSHSRHILTTGTGPKLGCDECHGTNSSIGKHNGHFDGAPTRKLPRAGFFDICEDCHGYDAEAGEVKPDWGIQGSTDCATCHAGLKTGATFNGKTPPASIDLSRTTGHNRPTSAGAYAQTGNPAANLSCTACHIAVDAGHWDGVSSDDMMLISGSGFPPTYAGNENAFCANCHGTLNTHRSKLCVACHNVHGEQNIQMIWRTYADQSSHDPSTGKYTNAAVVTFTNVTDFTVGNTNSYDEDDGTAGSAQEANSDDLCATCHSSGAANPTLHNNKENTDNKAPTGHKLGDNCFPCHATHTDSTDAFKVGVGTACDDCHGYPPNTGAHGNGADNGHTRVILPNMVDDDRDDCAFCHTGANLYTYDLTADAAAGGARANHASGNRVTVLQAAAVGYFQSGNLWGCTNACHTSSAADSFWFDKTSGTGPDTWGKDTNGISCNACHYYAASPVSGNNLSDVHDEHFAKGKACSACHSMAGDYGGGTGHAGPLTHINSYDFGSGNDGNDGAALLDRAQATVDEAGYDEGAGVRDVLPAMNYTDANTCSGGGGLGCHASGTPDWDVPIPATNAGCLECHSNTNDAAYNPTSGVHDNSPSPTITGNAHDGSFDNGAAGIADCITCHTASPTGTPANHINGTLNTGAAIFVAASAGYSVATGDCATTCHTAGVTWRYKWTTNAYASDNVRECNGCHGLYSGIVNSTGWTTGTSHVTSGYETRGAKHNNAGTSPYPCDDCHANGSAGYTFGPWKAAQHGDNTLQLNNHAQHGWVDAGATIGCNLSCHGDDVVAYRLPDPGKFAISYAIAGNKADVSCSGCHGGGTTGSIANYWPDGSNTPTTIEDNAGAHAKHMAFLAMSIYGETATGAATNDILRNSTALNPGITSDTKQQELCKYCHGTAGTPIVLPHGNPATDLPAEVNTMYNGWLPKTVDNGSWSPSPNFTCATVNCHSNKTTPTTNDWYDTVGNGNCLMCHVDITNGAVPNSNGGTHVAHTGAATTFGRAITCDDCHKTASETVAWGSPGTPPTNNHINGALTVTGSVPFTYSAGSCGMNACHNVGDGVTAPVTNPYPWGTALANCTICHAGSPATGAHTKHLAAKVVTYVPGSCAACHTNSTTSVITASSHIDGTRNANGSTNVVYTAANGTCTNTCHAGSPSDWRDNVPSVGCNDCHAGSGAAAYIGGDKTGVAGPNYMPQYNMHTVVPVTSGKVHTDTGLGTTCQYCHDGITPLSSHVDGTWATDNANNLAGGQGRGLFTGFVDAAIPTCSGSNVDLTGVVCHIDNGTWTRTWNANAANNNETRCANCHGYWASGADGSGWRTGTSHAPNPTRGSTVTHNDVADALFGFECYRCHVLGGSGDVYHWANGTNDWATDASATTQHGNNKIEMNKTGVTANDHNISGRSGCTSCHEGAVEVGGNGNSHDYPTSYFAPPTPQQLDGADSVSSGGGGCDGCHGSGGSFAPDASRGNAWPDRTGKHPEHMAALAAAGISGTDACNYCHPYSSGSAYVVGEHNDAGLPATMPNGTSNYYRRIIGGANDSNGNTSGSGSNYVTCGNIDCHFDMPRTPHWYTDDIAPAAVALTAVAGPKPRSIKVSWTSPGDDANVADTTPYVYDLRIGPDATTAQNFALTTNYAGNIPAAYKQGSTSEAIIQNLNAGSTYWFSLKTRDTTGTWSTASTAVSAQPTVDTIPPAFGGADKAVKGDASGTVYLEWTPAEDHTMPITYKVWRKAESAGALNMDVDTPLLTGVKAHNLVLTSASPDLLVNDTIYNFGVRACDANNNCDDNDQIVSATPTAVPLVAKEFATYRTNGNTTLVKNGTAGTELLLQTLPKTFAAANVTKTTTIYSDSFAVYVNAANGGATILATLGYSTNGGGNFTPFSTPAITSTVNVASRAKRVVAFKLVDVGGHNLTAGQGIAVQLTVTAGAATIDYGSTAKRGDLTLAEQFVNALPTNPAVNATVSGANVNVTWTASTDIVDGLSDTVHYDLFGSDDNGATYRYLIASNIPAATTNYSWNTQEDGISGAVTAAVKLLPGDGYGHYTGATTTKTALAVSNTNDNVAPSAVTDLVAKARPKTGSVMLIWTAPGDDEHNNGRAKYYDIRYDTRQIVESGGNGTTTIDFSAIPVTPTATSGQCVNEPSPDFGGEIQNFEVTGLTPGQNYYFAIKTYDDGSPAKVSPISTPKYPGPTPPRSDQALGGPRCGMCHSTAPSIVESVGNHKLHGFTLVDCAKCHGAAAATFGLNHQDGVLKMGYGPSGAVVGVISTTTIANDTITYTDTSTSKVMYKDVNGYGGFGSGNYASVGDGIDDGTCINFGSMGVGGCHGSAGTDPDGGGALPTIPTPTWNEAATLNCAACHGNPAKGNDTFYNRPFDATTANAGVVPEQLKGAPVVDNHGNYKLTILEAPNEKDRKFIGQHEKHLNYSFRFSKGDSCNLCHAGNYADVSDLDGRHANGDVDVKLDKVAAGVDAAWAAGTATTAGTCSNMSPDSCHPAASLPKWDSAQTFDCVGCHNMGGATPAHVTDPAGGVIAADNGWATDQMAGNCTYCHLGGHPLDTVGGTSLILANSSQVGISYRSGGIHIKSSIGGRAARTTEAELCWQCHDANNISEWGADTGANNVSTRPANASDYNYGQIYTSATYATPTSNWTTGYWKSPVANFDYKKAAIQSTHSTNDLAGVSNVTGGLKARVETKDAVGNIRCSNCHDVHNLNRAPGDTMTGQPYLRGSWIRNPYPEDGAPWNKVYTSVNLYGPVPRGGTATTTNYTTLGPVGTPNNQQGGFQIDQNNNYPTAGLSVATSAGLCTLCHGTAIDSMDKTLTEGFWLGTNGHSNGTLGGTGSAAANIFGEGIGGRPAGNSVLGAGTSRTAADVFDMGAQYVMNNGTPGTTRGLSYRSKRYTYLAPMIAADYAYQAFDWGVTVAGTIKDIGYHAFTCSKCHNPHASRLPKLMITNCLDTGHNTWDNGQGSTQNFWTSTADNGEYTADHNTAQNCHRFDASDNVGGWNTVTPW